MPNDFDDIDVICPFYRRTEKNLLVCEGLYQRTTLCQGYPSRQSLQAHMARQCSSFAYRQCALARLLEQKYAGDEPPLPRDDPAYAQADWPKERRAKLQRLLLERKSETQICQALGARPKQVRYALNKFRLLDEMPSAIRQAWRKE